MSVCRWVARQVGRRSVGEWVAGRVGEWVGLGWVVGRCSVCMYLSIFLPSYLCHYLAVWACDLAFVREPKLALLNLSLC